MSHTSEFGVSDKASSATRPRGGWDEHGIGDGGGLLGGLKLQRIESFPYYRMMAMHHRHRPFPSLSSSSSSSQNPQGHDGPTEEDSSRRRNEEGSRSITTRLAEIQDVTTTNSAVRSRSGAGGGAVARTLQPFHISASSITPTNSPPGGEGGMMAASLGFPFTLAQWKELERQAMIYKYMMASVPVPPDLLFPLPLRNLSDSSAAAAAVSLTPHHYGCSRGDDVGGSSILNLRFKSGVDPEIGRCRRTDGKKWRCTRDVAPNQKYCERHLHRGRPRSRKPVELLNSNPPPPRLHRYPTTTTLPTTTNTTITVNTPAIASPSPFIRSSPPHPYHHHQETSSPFDLHTIASASSCSSPYRVPRSQDWVVKEGIPIRTSNQRLQSSFYNANIDASMFNHQHYQMELPDSNSYGEFGPREGKPQNEQCPLFLDPDLFPQNRVLPSQTPIRGFIDAWSNSDKNESSSVSSSSNTKVELSDLTLSMAMVEGNLIDQEMGRIETGLALSGSDRIDHGSSGGCGFDVIKPHPDLSSWLSPVSWAVAPTPGGPLAEVLRPSNFAGGGESVVSSPSGVIQKTMSSVSDSSGTGSPTTTVRQEIAFPWFSQG